MAARAASPVPSTTAAKRSAWCFSAATVTQIASMTAATARRPAFSRGPRSIRFDVPVAKALSAMAPTTPMA